jgi:hypothetical protein
MVQGKDIASPRLNLLAALKNSIFSTLEKKKMLGIKSHQYQPHHHTLRAMKNCQEEF